MELAYIMSLHELLHCYISAYGAVFHQPNSFSLPSFAILSSTKVIFALSVLPKQYTCPQVINRKNRSNIIHFWAQVLSFAEGLLLCELFYGRERPTKHGFPKKGILSPRANANVTHPRSRHGNFILGQSSQSTQVINEVPAWPGSGQFELNFFYTIMIIWSKWAGAI